MPGPVIYRGRHALISQNSTMAVGLSRIQDLETNPNALYRLDIAERETPEDFYKFALGSM
jgi:hypothetical protein